MRRDLVCHWYGIWKKKIFKQPWRFNIRVAALYKAIDAQEGRSIIFHQLHLTYVHPYFPQIPKFSQKSNFTDPISPSLYKRTLFLIQRDPSLIWEWSMKVKQSNTLKLKLLSFELLQTLKSNNFDVPYVLRNSNCSDTTLS